MDDHILAQAERELKIFRMYELLSDKFTLEEIAVVVGYLEIEYPAIRELLKDPSRLKMPLRKKLLDVAIEKDHLCEVVMESIILIELCSKETDMMNAYNATIKHMEEDNV